MNEEEMRLVESIYNTSIPQETYLVLRLDGRAFTKMTNAHFQKPFDEQFFTCMTSATKALMFDFDASCAYTGSDEISIVLGPTWNQFDRRIEKLLSISASIVSSAFSLACGHITQFDSRILSFSSMSDVLDYLHYRQLDVRKNALSTALYWSLRKKMSAVKATTIMATKNTFERHLLLLEQGIDFEHYPAWAKNGALVFWITYEKEGYNPITDMKVVAERAIQVQPIVDNVDRAELEKKF